MERRKWMASNKSLIRRIVTRPGQQKSSVGRQSFFAGRGEKGGLLVLLIDDGMIAPMALTGAQARYNRIVVYFTPGRLQREA
jgi:hypothetical protein